MTLKIEPLSAAPGFPVERAVGRLEPVMGDTESKQLADLAMNRIRLSAFELDDASLERHWRRDHNHH